MMGGFQVAFLLFVLIKMIALMVPQKSGRLYVFEHYLGFHGSFFSNKIALAFCLRQITNTRIIKKTLFMKSDIHDLQGMQNECVKLIQRTLFDFFLNSSHSIL